MAKANAEATAERVDHLQGMILAGQPTTVDGAAVGDAAQRH